MPFHRLDCLSDDICWLIFEQHAFPGRDPADHMDLVWIRKKIVEKCKGLPLAVKVLASLLRNEFDHDKWEEILQSVVWHVPNLHDEIVPALGLSYLHLPSNLKPCFLYASIFPKDYEFDKEQLVQLWMAQGFLQCEGGKEVEDIGNMYFDDLMQRSFFSPARGLSFLNDLYVMHDLLHDLARHISQGEISSRIGKEEVDGDKLFPVGESEVRHLSISHQGIKGIERMLQSLCSDEPRVIRSLLVVLSQKCRDVDELKLPNEMILNLACLRALDLTCFRKIYGLPDSMGYLRHLRYLNLRGTEGIKRLPETIGMLYSLQVVKLNNCLSLWGLPESIGGLCNLRYLNLDGCLNLMSLPESIGALCNLRYLNLNSCRGLGSLPESIRGLCNLRYLNLNFCQTLRSLPESIRGLSNLQCLEIQHSYPSYPRGMSKLTNLRSLVGFTVESRRRGIWDFHTLELLKDWVHLRGVFGIHDLANVVNPEDAVTANLRNKEHIRQLCLDWGWGNGDSDDGDAAYHVLENLRPSNGLQELRIYNYSGVRFPSWMGGDASSFSRLTRVQLLNCRSCTLLPPLGQLPSLKHLLILDASSVERVGPEFWGMGFPVLEVLHFEHMPSWVTWDAAEREDFPRLHQLTVSECPKLQSMVPVYLFPSLQQLQIRNCSSLPSIELNMTSSSSSSSSSTEPPPLVKMSISECPLARFSPEDEPLLLPATLWDFSIYSGCPLLLEWCRREDGRRRLAHIPLVHIPELEIM